MADKILVRFIKQARKRGYDDYEIREPLLKKGWDVSDIDSAFAILKPKYEFKNKLTIYLDSEILKAIEKRAKKNIFTVAEQVEDIIRRSVISAKPATAKEKLDDMLVGLFSRKRKN